MRGAVSTAILAARSGEAPAIAAAGAQNLLDQPEFHDLRKLRSILRIVEEQKTLYDMVADAMTHDAPSVKIGRELGSEEMADLSVVTVPYRFGSSAIGMLSILGPRRMPYARLVALASGTAETLSQRLSDADTYRTPENTNDAHHGLLRDPRRRARRVADDEIKRAYRALARKHHPDVARRQV